MTAAFVHLFNAEGGGRREHVRCKGMCHGISDMGQGQELSPEQYKALLNGTLSGAGAVISGAGCAVSGTTCGLAVVLAGDSARQFTLSVTGTDPVYDFAVSDGLTQSQAAQVVTGVNVLTATVTIKAAYAGVVFRSALPATAGGLGVTALDGVSTVNTAVQLNQ